MEEELNVQHSTSNKENKRNKEENRRNVEKRRFRFVKLLIAGETPAVQVWKR